MILFAVALAANPTPAEARTACVAAWSTLDRACALGQPDACEEQRTGLTGGCRRPSR